MEVTEDNLDPVHALRHTFLYGSRHDFQYTFEPSDYLEAAIQRYVKPRATRPRSLLYASRLVSMDTIHYPLEDINASYEVARLAFMKQHTRRLEVGGEGPRPRRLRVGHRRLPDGSLRVGMLPRNSREFDTLLAGFDGNLQKDAGDSSGEGGNHFLYTTISANVLNVDAIEAATRSLAQGLSRPEHNALYTVSPDAVKRGIEPTVIDIPEVEESN